MVEKLNILKGSRNAELNDLVRPDAGYVSTIEGDFPGGDVIKTGYQVENGRLSGAIGTDDGEDFTFFNFKRNVIDRADTAEKF